MEKILRKKNYHPNWHYDAVLEWAEKNGLSGGFINRIMLNSIDYPPYTTILITDINHEGKDNFYKFEVITEDE